MNVSTDQPSGAMGPLPADAPTGTAHSGIPPAPGWRSARADGDPRRKLPLLASILSAMPGLGQVYVGYYGHGFLNILIVGSVISTLAFNSPGALTPLLGLFLAFFWLYNIVDAGRRAAFYNQALAGGAAVRLPTDLTLPAPGGSLLGGLVLFAAGFLILLDTAFDVSLDWLQDWWPAIPMLFGAYLVGRWWFERERSDPA